MDPDLMMAADSSREEEYHQNEGFGTGGGGFGGGGGFVPPQLPPTPAPSSYHRNPTFRNVNPVTNEFRFTPQQQQEYYLAQ